MRPILPKQFNKEFAKANISLTIDGLYEVVELTSEKQEYASSPVWVAPVLREVRNIDSKSGAYEVAVEERTEFADPRINKIAQEIYNEASLEGQMVQQRGCLGFIVCFPTNSCGRSGTRYPRLNLLTSDIRKRAKDSRSHVYVYAAGL